MTELMEAARVLGVGSVAHPVGSDVDYLGMVALGFPVEGARPYCRGDSARRCKVLGTESYPRRATRVGR